MPEYGSLEWYRKQENDMHERRMQQTRDAQEREYNKGIKIAQQQAADHQWRIRELEAGGYLQQRNPAGGSLQPRRRSWIDEFWVLCAWGTAGLVFLLAWNPIREQTSSDLVPWIGSFVVAYVAYRIVNSTIVRAIVGGSIKLAIYAALFLIGVWLLARLLT